MAMNVLDDHASRGQVRVGALLFVLMWLPGFIAVAGSEPVRGAMPAVPTHDPRVQRALEWLGEQSPVPIEVVDVDRLTMRIRREVQRACAFMVRGAPRIYVSPGASSIDERTTVRWTASSSPRCWPMNWHT
jgi:hypothetical protein